jgi:hypothetical protein
MSRPPLETVVAWALDELARDEAERFEEHYFGCDACFKRAEHVHRMIAELDASLPSVLTPERRRDLEARHANVPAVRLEPGQAGKLHVGAPSGLGMWVMRAPVRDAARVDFEARTLEGELLFSLGDVPFDAERGEVVLACQVHYRALETPPNFRVRLSAIDHAGAERVAEYTLAHAFDSV